VGGLRGGKTKRTAPDPRKESTEKKSFGSARTALRKENIRIRRLKEKKKREGGKILDVKTGGKSGKNPRDPFQSE